jgi:small-conductance mechanosensitive channel
MSESLIQLLDQIRPWLEGRPLFQVLLILVGSVIVAWLVDLILTRAIAVWAKRTKTDLDDRLIALVHPPLFTSVFLAGVWLAANRLDLAPEISLLLLGLLKTVALFLWTVFAVRASSIILEALSHLEGRVSLIEPRTLALAENAVKVFLFGGAAYLFFLSWGIDVGGWLVSAGVLGLVLGLAAKDTLSNLFAGIFILADAPYKVGDFVNLDSGERGQVTDVGLRSTRLLTRDDIEVTVPNSVIAASTIINESGGPWEKERVRVKVGVAYGTEIDQVRAALMAVARENEHVVDQPEPRVRLRAFGDSALEFELLGWIDRPVLRGRVLDALYEGVYKRFQRDGIEIPFPQRDIHLHGSASEIK